MSVIKNYIKNKDGTYTIVVDNVVLTDKEERELKEGGVVEADVNVVDPEQISVKQRKLIFGLLNDIDRHTGQPVEDLRSMFQGYVQYVHGFKERISLSNCDMKTASLIIETILAWCFFNEIPLLKKNIMMMKDDKSLIYLCIIKRKCIICGEKAELAHMQAVGRGRNRNKIDHYGNKILPLCHNHHKQQHSMGIKSFNEHYLLEDAWMEVDERLNKMLKGQK